ncbi:MAG TPA: hypothetical protein PKG63_00480 [Bacteroidales bacterium]|jgi:hypothetical protein|nr:hypothetical protein [Bacteroidales bacterium]HNV94919.1 hypothetical protein [Bacteroidales bacterium]HOU99374.1 hypothetical protein [Bacteroidales bacterium]
MKILFVFLFLITAIYSYCGNENWPLGGKQAGMGFTGVTISDVWSSSHNQAGLARLSIPTLGLYNENRFLLQTTSLKALSFAMPTNEAGVFALDLSYFGYEKYNESKVGLAYAMMIGHHFSIGAKVNYLNTHFAEVYGNKGHVVAEFGFLAEPAEHLFIGGHIYNISRTKLAVYDDERIPSTLTVGIGYRFTEKLFMTTEAEKTFTTKMIYKIGLDYRFMNNLYMRAGATTSPDQLTFGLGYVIKKIKADISFSYHQVLGITPHVGIIYNFKYETTANIAN